MIRTLLAFALLFGAAVPASAQIHGVPDPTGFVRAIYARYQARPNIPPPNVRRVYSPDLRHAFERYEAWSRRHPDVVGAIDFDWWTNAQDYRIRNVSLTRLNEGVSLRWVIARFDNYDRHEEIRFRFVRLYGRWYLDDVMQGTGAGDNGWTLSALLRRREE